MRLRTVIRAGTMALMLAACDAPIEPVLVIPDGWLVVRLVSPHEDDGGILFTVTGARVDSLRLPTGYQAAARQISEDTWRVLVTGDLAEGTVGRFFVPDTRRIEDYHATIEQVAMRGTYQQRDTTGYELQIKRP